MRLATRSSNRAKPEPTIALINIVFLMLIFFIVAAQIAPPLDGEVKLVSTESLDNRRPPDALVVMPDGLMKYRGALVTPAHYVTIKQESAPDDIREIRLVPDRELPAAKLIDIGRELRGLGAEKIMLVTEQGLKR
ncbi:ExbD/TolR family protein [Hoeflea alexandrii]|uniref:Biopolymer transporter ExbD n=1 Tax=Hoeflea alexandrii TaxID=288436 RepID=A0ABT1CS68_9HYPH|nr:biopolymer transporter ExbD [Hoeflea alexandrii]MCO6408231.1 biopolymer transporter ExbD [Hoeflea alexandrii]MCY0153460.1 biopolymer transporter ExbD [Hoeflea alexandrii]